MSSSSSSSSSSSFDAIGTNETEIRKVEPQRWSDPMRKPPPKPLLIVSPTQTGDYPLLLFFHGYLLRNSFYTQLLQQIASQGFIVIAPQLYSLAGADATAEVKSAAAITNWLSLEVLPGLLPPRVRPDLTKVALAGHSRGGKVAFALALNKVPDARTALKFSALIAIDPVDGMGKGRQTPPAVLTGAPRAFDLDMAVLVIGSGLGAVRRYGWFPASAPEGVSHEEFFKECRRPAGYFVVRGYGHVDMLDDETAGVRGKLTYCLCENGESRGPMRSFVGGAVAAFMKAYLEEDGGDLMAIRHGKCKLPVELQRVGFLD